MRNNTTDDLGISQALPTDIAFGVRPIPIDAATNPPTVPPNPRPRFRWFLRSLRPRSLQRPFRMVGRFIDTEYRCIFPSHKVPQ